MEVYFGIILIAEIGLTIFVDSRAEAPEPEPGPEPKVGLPNVETYGYPYRKIFASYSHKDLPIVQQFEEFHRASGDDFMRDWTHLRAGQVWSDQLQRTISEADVFQLFWSRNSMESDFVRQEWEYALGLRRPSFIRPAYWEQPMPEQPGTGVCRRRPSANCNSTGSRYRPPTLMRASILTRRMLTPRHWLILGNEASSS
jgi:hypothetical protein